MIQDLIAANAARWAKMNIAIGSLDEIDAIASRLIAADAKARYVDVSGDTHVPWALIAVIHEREADQNWKANIAQGDPWNRVSIHVPKGRGPFTSWESAACDALCNCAPFASKWQDWSVGGSLTLLEQYNGLGYAKRGVASPYIWSSTDQYVKGKYTSDGHYDPAAIDRQTGCAALLSRMMHLDPTITFTETTS